MPEGLRFGSQGLLQQAAFAVAAGAGLTSLSRLRASWRETLRGRCCAMNVEQVQRIIDLTGFSPV
jgi:hypothetical protein